MTVKYSRGSTSRGEPGDWLRQKSMWIKATPVDFNWSNKRLWEPRSWVQCLGKEDGKSMIAMATASKTLT
jgi:hypothetical protein